MAKNVLNEIDELLKRRLAESESQVITEVGKFMEDEILPTLHSHTESLKKIETNTARLNDDLSKVDRRSPAGGHLPGVIS